jgi:hypothetical protein
VIAIDLQPERPCDIVPDMAETPIVSETPTVSLQEFIDGLMLSDDQEDVELVMQAMQLNRIKVGHVIVAHDV